MKILLVEDDVLSQKVALAMLTGLNCQVIAVSTGESALNKINNEDFDLIMMDLGLPDCDGFKLIKAIRDNNEIPICALTAHALQTDKQRALNLVVNYFLAKPASLDDIKHVIEQCCCELASH